jgi:2-amino-4-hydroxy-6-hydroxymethyldihydropteridine diphosphokinase
MYQTVYLGLGTNLGDKKNNLKNALNALLNKLGNPVKVSSIYYSKPWGFDSPNSFFNIVVSYKTLVNPQQLLSICMNIESKLGRKRKDVAKYESRTIDIDILLFGDLVVNNKNLKIPHPLIKERLFVLEPLLEICDQKNINIYKSFLDKLKT